MHVHAQEHMMSSSDIKQVGTVRTIVDIPEPELKAIKSLAKRERISQAEAVRRAVRHYLATHRAQLTDQAFGLWAGRRDGLAYQEDLRDEWER